MGKRTYIVLTPAGPGYERTDFGHDRAAAYDAVRKGPKGTYMVILEPLPDKATKKAAIVAAVEANI